MVDLFFEWYVVVLFGLLIFDFKVRWGYGVLLILIWGYSFVLNVEFLYEGD